MTKAPQHEAGAREATVFGFGPAFWLVWFAAACIIGMIALARHRAFAGYFIASLVLSPLIALVILLMTGDGQQRGPCPECKEPVIVGAARCPHCQTELEWP